MAEAFKHLINAHTIRHASEHLQRAWTAFDRKRFEHQALQGLDGLEFKARAMQMADALEACLPPDFDQAASVLERSLAPPLPFDAPGEPIGLGAALHPAGLAGWVLWGAGEWVARRGMGEVPRALTCLHALTQRFTAEFAIRPFIAAQPSEVFETLARWTHEASPHVRRLVSEGSRPRLPWGLRLQALVADPTPTWPLLRALQDDPSAYVRRSVANHLNDIAKDHPERVAQWLRDHLPGASAERTALLRHASRSLIKQGHTPTLRAWGLSPGLQGQTSLSLLPGALCIGETLTLSVQLRSTGEAMQALIIDYAVHHVRAGGKTGVKVFKGWKRNLAPGETLTLSKNHPLREVSTRRLYPGTHQVDLLVNGEPQASASFDLHPASSH